MKTIPTADSSFLKQAAYSEQKQCLRILINSTYYYYYGITIQKVYRLKNAVSAGKYFCQHIKGQYKCIKRAKRS